MARRQRFVLIEFLMEAVCVTALVAMLALIGVQSSSAVFSLSDRRSAQHLAETKSALEHVTERQVLHFLDSSEFAGSSDDLKLASSSAVAIELSVSGDGWSATAFHEQLGEGHGCAVYFGSVPPSTGPATPSGPGEVYCTE